MSDGAQTRVPDDHPLMIAWRKYLETESFANSKRWAEQSFQGEMWSAFTAGFRLAVQSIAEGGPDAIQQADAAAHLTTTVQ